MESKRDWYALVYRCRRCGAIEEDQRLGLSDFKAADLMMLLVSGHSPVRFRQSFEVYPRSYHRCKDGYGVAEVVGLRNREAEEQARRAEIEQMIAEAKRAKEATQ